MGKEELLQKYIYLTVFVNGAVILVIEILGTRLLSPYFGSTIFVWSSLITITLGALSVGYYIGGKIADRSPSFKSLFSIIILGSFSMLVLHKFSGIVVSWSDNFGFQLGPVVASLVIFFLPLMMWGMVAPFAIRLKTNSLKRSGTSSGTIFAVATVGSVVGALITGFYLISKFTVSDIMNYSSLLLLIISVIGLILQKEMDKVIVGLLVVSLLSFLLPNYSEKLVAEVLYSDNSFYGDIEVVERDSIRCLLVGSQGQTCINTETAEQMFDYPVMISDYMNAAGMFDEQTGNLLIIGFGGGVMARDLSDKFAAIDGVEIDGKVVEVGEKYFGYDPNNQKIKVHITDGRTFVKYAEKKYDVIILDAFSGVSPVPHLHTKEAFSEINNVLSDEGTLFVNTIGFPYGEKAGLQKSLFKTMKEVFPNVLAMNTEGESGDIGNIVFVASNSELEEPFDGDFIVSYSESILKDEQVLTDGRNPVELLGIPIFEEQRRGYRQFLAGI